MASLDTREEERCGRGRSLRRSLNLEARALRSATRRGYPEEDVDTSQNTSQQVCTQYFAKKSQPGTPL